jgi:HEAT repeat protein
MLSRGLLPIFIFSAVAFAHAAEVEFAPPAKETESKVGEILKNWLAGSSNHSDPAEWERVGSRLAALGPEAVVALQARLDAVSPKTADPAVGPIITALQALNASPCALKFTGHAIMSPDYNLRSLALKAIAALAAPEEIDELSCSLVTILNPPNEIADQVAHDQMLSTAIKTISSLGARSPQHTRQVVQHLSMLKGAATEICKFNIIETLKLLESRGAEEMLLSFLGDGSARVRKIAVGALGYMKSARAPQAILPLLKSSDIEIRREAVLSLGRMKYMLALEEIIPLIDSQHSAVKVEAGVAVKMITGRSFPNAATATQWLDEAKARENSTLKMLQAQMLTQPPELMPVIIEELGKLVLRRDKVVEILLPTLNHDNFRVRAAACAVLGRAGDSRAILPLISRLAEPSLEVSFAAWRALVLITDKELARDPVQWRMWLDKKG